MMLAMVMNYGMSHAVVCSIQAPTKRPLES